MSSSASTNAPWIGAAQDPVNLKDGCQKTRFGVFTQTNCAINGALKPSRLLI
jgi:hypothetical protein